MAKLLASSVSHTKRHFLFDAKCTEKRKLRQARELFSNFRITENLDCRKTSCYPVAALCANSARRIRTGCIYDYSYRKWPYICFSTTKAFTPLESILVCGPCSLSRFAPDAYNIAVTQPAGARSVTFRQRSRSLRGGPDGTCR
jgi:hypothetical protein